MYYSSIPAPDKKLSIDLDSFSTIDSIWEDFSDWSHKSRELSRLRNSHRIFRIMWDGIKKPEAMPIAEILIRELKRRFPDNESCRVGRPLGDFKDLMGLSHEEIFDSLVEQITMPRINGDGEASSYLEELEHQCSWLWENFFEDEKRWLKWNREAFLSGLALMLYGSSIGIYLEGRTHAALASWLERFPKAAEIFTYEPAPSELESKDVDGVFRHRDSGEVAVAVSVKCLGALNQRFIEDIYRGKKGKTAPDIYIGYRNADDEKLSTVEIDGDLKELLRRAI